MDLLDKLNEVLGKPVKLSDTEKEKVKAVFALVTDWILAAEVEILELDAEEAYRRIGILNSQLAAAQQAWLKPTTKNLVVLESPVIVLDNDVVEKPQLVEPVDPARFPVVGPESRPSLEDMTGWLDALTGESKIIAQRLDCIKDLDELGVEVLCNYCTQSELMQCIRNEDPNFENADTVFLKEQLR